MPSTPSLFEKALSPVGANPSLQGTMTGQEMAPAPNTDAAPFDQAISDAYGQLNQLLSSMPEVDYQKQYAGILDEVNNRPVPEAPNPLASFAFALGSPDKAPTILHEKMQKRDEAQQKKDDDMLRLKEKLLEGTIQQEVAEGKFKSALSQSEKLSEIQRHLADRERSLDMKDWKEKQGIKSKDAKELVTAKVQAVAQNFNLDAKMQLKVMDFAMTMYRERLRQKNLLGMPVEDIPSESIMNEIMPDIENMARSLVSGKPLEPKKDEATAPAAAPVNPYAAALQEVLKEDSKK